MNRRNCITYHLMKELIELKKSVRSDNKVRQKDRKTLRDRMLYQSQIIEKEQILNEPFNLLGNSRKVNKHYREKT